MALAAERIRRRGLRPALDALIYALSVYGVPLATGLLTLVAVFAWDRQLEAGQDQVLALKVLRDDSAALGAAQAAERLRDARPVMHHDTRLSEAPFWFAFTAESGRRVQAELASRHALRVECWESATLRPLGSADRGAADGQMRAIKAGFAIDLGYLDAPVEVLCRGLFAGPARISVLQWSGNGLAASAREFQHNAGLLEGGLVVLSVFVLVTAIINREWLYVLFAAWLLASLRLGALSAGWDTQWMGRAIPPDWLLPVRKLTIAFYFVVTYALFARLFREDLLRVRAGWPLGVAQWSCVAILVAAAVLPFSGFVQVLWVAVGVGASVIVFYLARILLVTRSRVAMWYGGSLAIVVFAGFSEVIAAALGVKDLIGAINSVTAALSSCLMAALAIAEQMRQERVERMQAQAELKSTYEAIPIGLFTLAPDGCFDRVNPALAAMLGEDPVAGPRRYWREHFEAGSWERLQEVLAEHGEGVLEIRGNCQAEEPPKWFHVEAVLTGDKIDGSLQDITERQQATEQLRFLVENDPLTGVLNRRGIEKAIEEATVHAAEGRPLAVAYLDLDRFKLINDLFGHLAGDDVLRQVCRRAERLLSDGCALGRIGGDEFVIVFRGSPIAAASAICRAIVDAIGAAPFQTGDKAFQVKASIGLVEVAGKLPVKDAIAVADRACRAAKAGVGDGLVVYDRQASVFADRAQEMRLVERLGTGGVPEGLFLVMQPIMSLTAPFESLNFEVLIRMREPDASVTPGGVIVAAAESNGRAAVLDRWVLSNTLAWLEQNHRALAATRFVTMNLSGASLNDERFIQDAFSMLAGSPHATERLCIEVTEGVALHDLANTRRFIDRVRGYGAKVALDDFGAGYTSFSYLKELPADALKIDGSFILNVNAHPANLSIVEAIAELARNLGMKSIAEWAEDRATVESLAGVGIDYVQGFAIARAQDPAAILAATSSAGFITDPDVLRYVRDVLGRTGRLARADDASYREGLH
ncbi:MAG: putative bifunctional diguanylate cyclase/phosphodiesterase [Burkholderiales bacterium]